MTEGNVLRLCDKYILNLGESKNGRRQIVSKMIGSGSFGTVYQGRHESKPTKKVAVKVIDLTFHVGANVNPKDLEIIVEEEIKLLYHIRNNGIKKVAKIFGHCRLGNQIFVVMRFYDKVLFSMNDLQQLREETKVFLKKDNLKTGVYRKVKRFKYAFIRNVVYSLAETLHALNNLNIIHRDLKPENVLMSQDEGKIILTDFNLSTKLENDVRTQVMKSNCGSLLYKAPEVFFGEPYDFKCDIWSLGIILYNMLSNGFFPFHVPNGKRGIDLVLDDMQRFFNSYQHVAFHGKRRLWWQFVDEGPKNLLSKLLQRLPQKRANYAEILTDPWLVSGVDSSGYDKYYLMTSEEFDNSEENLAEDYSDTEQSEAELNFDSELTETSNKLLKSAKLKAGVRNAVKAKKPVTDFGMFVPDESVEDNAEDDDRQRRQRRPPPRLFEAEGKSGPEAAFNHVADNNSNSSGSNL